MAHPIYFWYITVGIVLLVFLVDFIHYVSAHKSSHKHHIVGMLRERDIFYVPGDQFDDDEFDD